MLNNEVCTISKEQDRFKICQLTENDQASEISVSADYHEEKIVRDCIFKNNVFACLSDSPSIDFLSNKFCDVEETMNNMFYD